MWRRCCGIPGQGQAPCQRGGDGSSGDSADGADAATGRHPSPSDDAPAPDEQPTEDLLDGFAMADQAGGPDADTLERRGDDGVRGRSGDDSLTGFDRAEVWGGGGEDTVLSDQSGDDGPIGHGSQGDDTMRAQGYGARLQGDRGDDTLHVERDAVGNVGRGDDDLWAPEFGTALGGRGEDLMRATDEGRAYGGAGRDFIGASFNGSVYGGKGDDGIRVSGGNYPDKGYGSRGDGGAGADVFSMTASSEAIGGAGSGTCAVRVTDPGGDDGISLSEVTIDDFDVSTDRLLVHVDHPVASFTLTEVRGDTFARIETVPVGTGTQTEGLTIHLRGVTGLTRDDFDLVDSITVGFERGPYFGIPLGTISPA